MLLLKNPLADLQQAMVSRHTAGLLNDSSQIPFAQLMPQSIIGPQQFTKVSVGQDHMCTEITINCIHNYDMPWLFVCYLVINL